jgi:hypothetical protein
MTTPTLTMFAALRLACRRAFASHSPARRRWLGAGSAPRGGKASLGTARQEA